MADSAEWLAARARRSRTGIDRHSLNCGLDGLLSAAGVTLLDLPDNVVQPERAQPGAQAAHRIKDELPGRLSGHGRSLPYDAGGRTGWRARSMGRRACRVEPQSTGRRSSDMRHTHTRQTVREIDGSGAVVRAGPTHAE